MVGAADQPRELTGEEQALYDRQIRLWGAEAQRRLSSARVLIVGAVTSALAQEVAKNVVLAGVARVVIVGTVEVGSSRGFLGATLDEVAQALRAMNPLVEVMTSDDAHAAVAGSNVVCSFGSTIATDLALGAACREHSVPFFSGRTAGPVGWLFLDLGSQYEFAPIAPATTSAKPDTTKEPAKEAAKEPVQPASQTVSYIPLLDALDAPWGGEVRSSEFGWHAAYCLLKFEAEHERLPGARDGDDTILCGLYERLQKEKKSTRSNSDLLADLARCAYVSLPSVAAIVGGVWGREVVKVLSRREEPLNNFFFYNARTSAGSVETIKSTASNSLKVAGKKTTDVTMSDANTSEVIEL